MLLNCIARSAPLSASAVVFARRILLHCGGASFPSAVDNVHDVDVRSMSSASNAQPDVLQTKGTQRTRRRTRRREIPASENKEPIPSLADFMHRAKVRKQYRNFIKLAQFVDGKDNNGTAGECRAAVEEVRLSYQMGTKKATDELSKNMAFSDGERRLRELEAMVGYSTKSNKEESNAGISPESYDDDSWINIKDEEDPRGRVGVQWPWEKDDSK